MDELVEAVTGRTFWGLVAAVAGVAVVGRGRLKPLAKLALKGVIGGREWLDERLAESTDGFQDLCAEARSEYRSARAARPARAAPAARTARTARAAGAKAATPRRPARSA